MLSFPTIGQSTGIRQLHVFKPDDVVVFCRVGHATVADLDCVAVEDFVQHRIFRKLFVEFLFFGNNKINYTKGIVSAAFLGNIAL